MMEPSSTSNGTPGTPPNAVPPSSSAPGRSTIGKLRKKERKFSQEVAKGENLTEAVIKAGYETGRANAGKMGSAMIHKPKIAAYVAELEKKIAARLDNDRLLEKHNELLDAGDGYGPQYNVQQKALEMAYKIKQFPGYGEKADVHLHKHEHTVTEQVYQDLEEGVIDA